MTTPTPPTVDDVAAARSHPAGGADETPICEARGVTVAFGTGSSKVVLRDVSLAVHAGEVVAILGPSGCGKSTLLRALVGLLAVTEGQVLAHGTPLAGIHPGISIVFQNFALLPHLTVLENVAFPLAVQGVPRPVRLARAQEMVAAH